ncbi:MAG: energy-coupling factor transporter transmembrane protein EcfT [Coriobacteriia bacterium]|nr:energy-coupling factor transporter transmembrane protein EcfT [Coriobacteriia bacterium]
MYIPGHSFIHALDPRVKLMIIVLVSILLFSINSPFILGLIIVLILVGYLVARVPFRALRTIAMPIMLISIFTLLANTIAWGGVEPDITVSGLGISYPGALRGLYFMLRLLALVSATTLIALTTSPVSLTDAITSILSPLRVLHVPVDDIALVFSIALRFIPTIADEAERIVLAQTARGAQFTTGSILTKVKAWIPVLVPLLVQLFRRADNLALAMESRCYTGEGRTRLRELKWHLRDTLALGAALVLCIVAWVLSTRGMI